MNSSLLALTDHARMLAVRSYGRQRLVSRAKQWIFATLASSLPGLRRPYITQTSVRLGGGKVRLWVDAHASVGLYAMMFGSYEPESMERLFGLARKLAVDAPVFVDVGANIGFYSIGFALAFSGARVIACEPGPAASDLCARNITAAAAQLRGRGSSVEVVKAAIADCVGEVSLTISLDAGHSSLLEVETFEEGSIHVPATTVAALSERFTLSRIDVCKVDVEGAELDVIRGMMPMLARGAISILQVEVNRPLWARSGRTPRELVDQFAQVDYALMPEQAALLGRNDWMVEDFIFVAPAAREYVFA